MFFQFLKNLFAFIGSITGIIGFIPQIYKTYIIKSAFDISMLLLINYSICCLSWSVYGYMENDKFILYSNVIGIFVSLISICQKVYYDKFK